MINLMGKIKEPRYLNTLDQLKMKKGFKEKLERDIRYITNSPYKKYIKEIYLFGSCSKGKETYQSDIDLGIITLRPLTRREKADIRGELSDISYNMIETNVVFIESSNIDTSIRLHNEILNGIKLNIKEK